MRSFLVEPVSKVRLAAYIGAEIWSDRGAGTVVFIEPPP